MSALPANRTETLRGQTTLIWPWTPGEVIGGVPQSELITWLAESLIDLGVRGRIRSAAIKRIMPGIDGGYTIHLQIEPVVRDDDHDTIRLTVDCSPGKESTVFLFPSDPELVGLKTLFDAITGLPGRAVRVRTR